MNILEQVGFSCPKYVGACQLYSYLLVCVSKLVADDFNFQIPFSHEYSEKRENVASLYPA